MPQAATARPAGGAAAEADSIPAAVTEYRKEVSDGGRAQRPGGSSRAAGHVHM